VRHLIKTGAVILLASLPFAARAAAAPAEPATKTPIKHFVVLMQENHSFDNYFGTYPGANGIPKGACQAIDRLNPSKGCIKPFHLGDRVVEDLNHSHRVAVRQYDHGKMDGFIDGVRREGGKVQPNVMGHYDDRDIPYYWNIADNYVLFDRFFTSSAGGSVGNHMFWVTGTVGNPDGDFVPPNGFDQPTIFDRLEKKHVSWKFYVQNYDPGINLFNQAIGDRGSQVIWVPILNYRRYLLDPKLKSHIVDMSQFYKDLARGTLPSVAYMAPSGSSEHPPGSIQAGERFIRTIVNSIMRTQYWTQSAFMWTYDDWGGWYDHVKPPQVDKYGFGFRAPALLVSAFARRGMVNHTQLDFTSMLKFIEQNWGLKPLAERDAKSGTLMSAFDFKSPPRKPVFLQATRPRPPAKEPHRSVIYIAYFIAVMAAGGLILGAGLIERAAGRVARRRRKAEAKR
jgi:phospholipase C